MKRALFAIGLPPCESHALRLSTLNQLREAVGTRNLP